MIAWDTRDQNLLIYFPLALVIHSQVAKLNSVYIFIPFEGRLTLLQYNKSVAKR